MSNVKVVNKAYKIELGSDGVAFKNADRSSEKNFKHSIKISLAQCFSLHVLLTLKVFNAYSALLFRFASLGDTLAALPHIWVARINNEVFRGFK